MSQINSYYLYKKYEKRGNQPWLPVFPNVWSVDGDGTMPLAIKETVDPMCFSDRYLTFTALEDGVFQFSGKTVNDITNTVSYSLDNGSTWTELASGASTPTVASGNSIMWKGECTPRVSGIGAFGSTGNFEVEGNVMSLLFGDNFEGQIDLTGYDYAFYWLFNNCKIVSAQKLSLPAKTLTRNCYYGMFSGCTSLTTAPFVLPATTVSFYGYSKMFIGCTNLITPPQLLATTLSQFCYGSMFQDCTSLTTAPILIATKILDWSYQWMFKGCTSLTSITCLATDIEQAGTVNWVEGVASNGTFTKANSMTSWTEGTSGIPSGWTVTDYTS